MHRNLGAPCSVSENRWWTSRSRGACNDQCTSWVAGVEVISKAVAGPQGLEGMIQESVSILRKGADASGGRRRFMRWLITLWSLLMIVGCHVAERESRHSDHSSVSVEATDPMPPRVDVVAMADDFASQAQRSQGSERSQLLLAAARLRERMWRLERRSADALESVDLYKQLADSGDCGAAISGSLLFAEYSQKPSLALAVTAKTQGSHTNVNCGARVRYIGAMLSAFKEKQTASSEMENSTPDGDEADTVMQPKLLDSPDNKNPTIQRIEKYVSPDSARIVISLSAPTTFRLGTLAENSEAGLPARMYLDIDNAKFAGIASSRHDGLVENIRIAAHPHGARIAIDLKYPAVRKVFYEPEPFRLVVDLARQGTLGLVHRAGARRVERIVLDPGHGGNDPGAIGPRGLREKDVTLDIAHRAAPIIARELGIATMLTRDVDDYVALDERTAHANAFGADLFVSIHCNAADNNESDGIVTFVLDGSSDAAAARIAALENSASAAASEELATAFRRIQDSAILERSVQFAQLLQRATVASLQGSYGHVSDKGVRRAGFYVLAGAVMPAVLFEVSFISNPDAEIRLNTGDYRQKLADAVVNAIRAYREGL